MPATSGPSGTHDGEPDVLTRREFDQGLDGVGGDVDIAYLGLERGARIAWGDEHLMNPGRLRAFPRQRMFAAATADDENLHAIPPSGGSDACR